MSWLLHCCNVHSFRDVSVVIGSLAVATGSYFFKFNTAAFS